MQGVCSVRGTHTVADGCVLDFGGRTLVLEATARLVVGPRRAKILAANLTMRSGSLIDVRGQGERPPTNRGGTAHIEASGTVVLEGGTTRARIDATGNGAGGRIQIAAGGAVEIHGRLLASHGTSVADGGNIVIEAANRIYIAPSAEITATGGAESLNGGGSVTLQARGDIEIGADVNVSGANGGQVDAGAGGGMVVSWIRANGTGVGGSGGSIKLVAYSGLQIQGGIRALGSGATYAFGGDGGVVDLDVSYGDLVVNGSILAEGAEPDGEGGVVTAEAAGSIVVGGIISVRANGSQGGGGNLLLSAGRAVQTTAAIDASGGLEGGELAVVAAEALQLAGSADARGRSAGSRGGEVKLLAGEESWRLVPSGEVVVSSTVDASAGGCEDGVCGIAGSVVLQGCAVQVSSSGRILSRGGGAGGSLVVTASRSIRIDGTLNAQRSVAAGQDGTILISHSFSSLPMIRDGGALPQPFLTPNPFCTPSEEVDCLIPCPRCGDGVQDFPEECDDGNATGCDGCSARCRFESCDPLVHCLACVPSLGCRPLPPEPCPPPVVPTPTSTPTQEPTRTATPVPSPTATLANPSATRSHTSTRTKTPTGTITPTTSHTATPTETHTAKVTPTSTATPVTRLDVMVEPLWPKNVQLSAPTPAVIEVRVGIRNLSTMSGADAPVRVAAVPMDCAPGAVDLHLTFPAALPVTPDIVLVRGSRRATGALRLFVNPQAIHAPNRGSPYRCRLLVRAGVALEGNEDPTPWNNVALLEVNLVQSDQPYVERKHQTVVLSARPTRIRFRRGQKTIARSLRVGVANADRLDVAGHAVTLVGRDGDCPPGTVGTPEFHRPGALPVDKVVVPNGRRRFAKVPIRLNKEVVELMQGASPYRCTLQFEAIGPSGDENPSDNTTGALLEIYAD
ncbi:MAG: hypothetical protein N3C12_14415 [Candidatus Binatia bacterium]|nr:hypothetical protein [Candidatus Binatia bacterium]